MPEERGEEKRRAEGVEWKGIWVSPESEMKVRSPDEWIWVRVRASKCVRVGVRGEWENERQAWRQVRDPLESDSSSECEYIGGRRSRASTKGPPVNPYEVGEVEGPDSSILWLGGQGRRVHNFLSQLRCTIMCHVVLRVKWSTEVCACTTVSLHPWHSIPPYPTWLFPLHCTALYTIRQYTTLHSATLQWTTLH